jgi:hypothetical protein
MAYEHNLGSADRYYGAIDAYRMANAAKTKTKIWVEQVSDAQEIFDFLQNEHSGFLNSMREAIANYGGLTEGQANARFARSWQTVLLTPLHGPQRVLQATGWVLKVTALLSTLQCSTLSSWKACTE